MTLAVTEPADACGQSFGRHLLTGHLQPADRVLGGRGCDHARHRRLVRGLGVRSLITRRGIEKKSALGSQRGLLERAFARLHWFRCLRIRGEVRADIHITSLTLG